MNDEVVLSWKFLFFSVMYELSLQIKGESNSINMEG